MKVYIYSQHIRALIISLGQNIGVQNVILPQRFYLFTLFSVLFLSYIHGFLPARGRKTDNITRQLGHPRSPANRFRS